MTSRPHARSAVPSRVTSQPLAASQPVRPADLDAARAGRPAVEEAVVVVGSGEVVERPVLGVLHDHRPVGEPLHGLEDLDRAGLARC